MSNKGEGGITAPYLFTTQPFLLTKKFHNPQYGFRHQKLCSPRKIVDKYNSESNLPQRNSLCEIFCSFESLIANIEKENKNIKKALFKKLVGLFLVGVKLFCSCHQTGFILFMCQNIYSQSTHPNDIMLTFGFCTALQQHYSNEVFSGTKKVMPRLNVSSV